MGEANVNSLPKREDLDSKYKWRLEDIYANEKLWDEDFAKVGELTGICESYRGRLAESADTLLKAMKALDEMGMISDKLFVYARMRRDEDNSNTVYQSMVDRATSMLTEAYARVAFYTPEITSIDETLINKFMEENKELSVYKFTFEQVYKNKEHVLSDKEEELLALSGEMADAADDIFSMFNNADIKFGEIKDEDGNMVELTKGRYTSYLESKDRRVREDAFKTLYASYSAVRNTLGATLASNVKKDKFYASVRKYNSCLEASLNGDDVSAEVYDNLIATVSDNLPKLDRYLKLRKKALGLSELHMYDLYVPIVKQPAGKYSYEEAKDIVLKGLAPLGEEYSSLLKKAFSEGWIDVYENQGKTSGAYSWGTYLTHPYVLLNYQGNINDVFTVAHELGHSLHSYYTNMTQPYTYSSYRIFVAEVASTVNESILMKYMLENTKDKAEKAYLINHYLEEFRGTVFRQVMFAEFEKLIHEKVENGEALTTDGLCELYYGLNEKFFAREVSIDREIEMEWSRIPHFYSSFYVYKYATGFAAATAISAAILKEGQSAVDRYLDFLKSGSMAYPLELLRKAGVDLSTPKPVEDCLVVFDELVDELEKLI